MPIDADMFAAIAARTAELELSEASITHLRREWPGVHFTFCGEDDIPARLKPVLEGQGFNLYLVSNAEHCIAFTSQLEVATGIVLASVEPE